MKRTLLLAAMLAASASAFAVQPEPSFKDYVEVESAPVTSGRTFEHSFPKSSYLNGGGPKGPATVLLQSIEPRPMAEARVPQPSFSG